MTLILNTEFSPRSSAPREHHVHPFWFHSDIRRAYEIENKDLNLGHGGLHKGYFMRSIFSTVQGSKKTTPGLLEYPI